MIMQYLLMKLIRKVVYILLVAVLSFSCTPKIIVGEYRNSEKGMFPTILCLTDSLTYAYTTDMSSKDHGDSFYTQNGTYAIIGDTIIFNNKINHLDGEESIDIDTFKGYIKKNRITIYSSGGQIYPVLKKKIRSCK